MILYEIKRAISGKVHVVTSPQFPGIDGFGYDATKAYINFSEKLDAELNAIMLRGDMFPRAVGFKKIKGREVLLLKASVAAKMHLHQVMVKSRINRADLARLLALTEADVKNDEWNLEYTRTLTPRKKKPDYKKVQRLLDVRHNSTFEEIVEAFRILDCDLDVAVRLRQPSNPKIVSEI